MCLPIALSRIVLFLTTFVFGLLVTQTANYLSTERGTTALEGQAHYLKHWGISKSSSGSGISGACFGSNHGERCVTCLACQDGKTCSDEVQKTTEISSEQLLILSKPRATYTDAAREYNIQGTVRLKVVFLKNGVIGSIQPITELPYGLTEQAVAAARLIRFEPKKVAGEPVNVTKIVEYSFSIY